MDVDLKTETGDSGWGASPIPEDIPNTLEEMFEARRRKELQYEASQLEAGKLYKYGEGGDAHTLDTMDRRKGDRCCPQLGKTRSITRHELQEYRSWSWYKFMTHLRGSVFPELYTWAIFYTLIALVAVVMYKYVGRVDRFHDGKSAHKWTLLPLAFLLVFRSNTAYARFTEGQMHFMALNRGLRELTRRTYTFIKDTREGSEDGNAATMRQNLMRMLIVLAISVRQQMRKRTSGEKAHNDNMNSVRSYLNDNEYHEYEQQVKNRPLLVMSWLGRYVHEAHLDHKLEGGIIMMGFDDNISTCLNGWMGMNKICFQPMPFPYLQFLHLLLLAWCVSFPMTLVKDYGWFTVLVTPLFACALYAIEEVSEEIEDPFGDDLNDLPTEDFEIGLQLDSWLVLSGPGPGRRGQDFKPVPGTGIDNQVWKGVDFSVPHEENAENEAKETPVYHDFDQPSRCPCSSCVERRQQQREGREARRDEAKREAPVTQRRRTRAPRDSGGGF